MVYDSSAVKKFTELKDILYADTDYMSTSTTNCFKGYRLLLINAETIETGQYSYHQAFQMIVLSFVEDRDVSDALRGPL